MNDDPRCCGSGTCIIDSAGRCWCGQQWNGERMCNVPLAPLPAEADPGPDAAPLGSTAASAPEASR
jgi:hypothetical protein